MRWSASVTSKSGEWILSLFRSLGNGCLVQNFFKAWPGYMGISRPLLRPSDCQGNHSCLPSERLVHANEISNIFAIEFTELALDGYVEVLSEFGCPVCDFRH